MLFHFDVRSGVLIEDSEGQEMPDALAVRAEAREVAMDLLGHGFRSGEDRRDWRIEVRDTTGRTALNLNLVEASLAGPVRHPVASQGGGP